MSVHSQCDLLPLGVRTHVTLHHLQLSAEQQESRRRTLAFIQSLSAAPRPPSGHCTPRWWLAPLPTTQPPSPTTPSPPISPSQTQQTPTPSPDDCALTSSLPAGAHSASQQMQSQPVAPDEHVETSRDKGASVTTTHAQTSPASTDAMPADAAHVPAFSSTRSELPPLPQQQPRSLPSSAPLRAPLPPLPVPSNRSAALRTSPPRRPKRPPLPPLPPAPSSAPTASSTHVNTASQATPSDESTSAPAVAGGANGLTTATEPSPPPAASLRLRELMPPPLPRRPSFTRRSGASVAVLAGLVDAPTAAPFGTALPAAPAALVTAGVLGGKAPAITPDAPPVATFTSALLPASSGDEKAPTPPEPKPSPPPPPPLPLSQASSPAVAISPPSSAASSQPAAASSAPPVPPPNSPTTAVACGLVPPLPPPSRPSSGRFPPVTEIPVEVQQRELASVVVPKPPVRAAPPPRPTRPAPPLPAPEPSRDPLLAPRHRCSLPRPDVAAAPALPSSRSPTFDSWRLVAAPSLHGDGDDDDLVSVRSAWDTTSPPAPSSRPLAPLATRRRFQLRMPLPFDGPTAHHHRQPMALLSPRSILDEPLPLSPKYSPPLPEVESANRLLLRRTRGPTAVLDMARRPPPPPPLGDPLHATESGRRFSPQRRNLVDSHWGVLYSSHRTDLHSGF